MGCETHLNQTSSSNHLSKHNTQKTVSLPVIGEDRNAAVVLDKICYLPMRFPNTWT